LHTITDGDEDKETETNGCGRLKTSVTLILMLYTGFCCWLVTNNR